MLDHAASRRRRDADRRRILAMEVVSGLGDGVFWVALIALLVDGGAGAFGFAAAAVARLAPRALLSAPLGAVADRYDRRVLLVSLDLARAATMFLIVVGAARDWDVAGVLALVLVAYALAAPYRPALTAALPLVVGETQLSRTNAAVGTTRQVMTFVGPLIGAAVVGWGSIEVAIAANALTFVVAAGLIAGVPALSQHATPRVGTPSPVMSEVGARQQRSWRVVLATPGIGVLLTLVAAMYFVRGAELVLYAVVADERLGLGAAGVGLLTGAVGLGALLALPAATRMAEHRRPDTVLAGSLLATAVPLAVMAVTARAAIDVAVLVVVGAGVVVFEVVAVVQLQRLADRQVLGRVFGLVGTASNTGKLAGALVAPVLVAAFGAEAALATTAAMVLLVVVTSAPALSRLVRTTRARRAELDPVVDHLSSLGVFDGASRVALERVAADLGAEEHQPGKVVIRQGDRPDDLYIVLDGTFDVYDGDRRINGVGPGEWFGEIGLLQQRARTASVVAATTATVWRIPGETFLSALQDMASEPTALMDVMAERTQQRGPA